MPNDTEDTRPSKPKSDGRGQMKMTTTARLETLMERGGFDAQEISEALHVTAHTIRTWRNKGRMPALAALACEGLLRRRKQVSEREGTLLIRGKHEHTETVRTVARSLSCAVFRLDWSGSDLAVN